MKNLHDLQHLLTQRLFKENMFNLLIWFSTVSFTDVVLPERPKLKFLNKVPNLKKAKKEMKKLRDIQGPANSNNKFRWGQYGILVGTLRFVDIYGLHALTSLSPFSMTVIDIMVLGSW